MARVLDTSAKAGRDILSGVYRMVPGAPDGANLNNMSYEGLIASLGHMRDAIDRNEGAGLASRTELTSFTDTAPTTTLGAKDIALDLIEREQSPAHLTDADEINQLHALMGLAGVETDDDWTTVTDEERARLDGLETQLESGVSLNSVFNTNYEFASAQRVAELEAAAEAEAAEKEAADIEKEIGAALVYAGYAEPEDLADDNKMALAMQNFMVNNLDATQLAAEEDKIFEDAQNGDWGFTPYANLFMRRHTGGMQALRLESDLESADPARIELAQAYLSLEGADIEINGALDRDTFAAGQAALNAPLSLPDGIVREDGSIDQVKLTGMAASGQLYLPMDDLAAHLSPADLEYVMQYPTVAERGEAYTTARETVVAQILVAKDPAGYQAILDAENARRATATLDAEVELPVVAIAAEATEIEERVDIAQNPAGLVEIEGGDTILDAAQPIADSIAANAEGVTDRSGYIVFGNQTVALSGIVDALTKDNGLTGDGEADGRIRLEGAVFLASEAFGEDVSATEYRTRLDAVTQEMGIDPSRIYDVNNPADRAAILEVMVTYSDYKAWEGSEARMNGGAFEDSRTSGRPDVQAAIQAAANGETGIAPPAPIAPDYELQTPTLRNYFNNRVDGPALLSGNDPAMSPQEERVANADVVPVAGAPRFGHP